MNNFLRPSGSKRAELERLPQMNMHPMIEDYDAVVLANGDFPSAEVPLQILREAQNVVACDGAAAPLLLEGGVSEGRGGRDRVVIIGDGDSVPDALRSRLIRIDEQEDNDLTKATRYCLKQGWRRIAYLGCTGKREDHTLGNVSLLMRYYREMDILPFMATDYGWFVPAQGCTTFESFPGQQVSIFNVSCEQLSSVGLKWQAYPYRQFWQGTLNEALSCEFGVKADGYYLVYRTYQTK